ncbi:hypothetical protein [Rhodococcus gannanensis]|uniref:Uncharacterized protein n=1 Tax=Rhodococcus gannanensis TaxID=1960308 RepID=A0ABW4P686_9NOCA
MIERFRVAEPPPPTCRYESGCIPATFAAQIPPMTDAVAAQRAAADVFASEVELPGTSTRGVVDRVVGQVADAETMIVLDGRGKLATGNADDKGSVGIGTRQGNAFRDGRPGPLPPDGDAPGHG